MGFYAASILNIVKIVPGFEPRIFAISLKPVPFFHSSKTEAFSSAKQQTEKDTEVQNTERDN
jgi:hypothetical protein